MVNVVSYLHVWDPNTVPSSFKPDVLVRRLGKIGSSEAAHLAQFVLTLAQKPSWTAASRRPQAQWVLVTTGGHRRATLPRLQLNLRCPTRHVSNDTWRKSWWAQVPLEFTSLRQKPPAPRTISGGDNQGAPPPPRVKPAEPPYHVVPGPQPPDGSAVTPTRTPLGRHNFSCLFHRRA